MTDQELLNKHAELISNAITDAVDEGICIGAILGLLETIKAGLFRRICDDAGLSSIDFKEVAQ